MALPTYWTLESDGVEKTFEDWGFGKLKRHRMTQGMDTCTFECVGNTSVTDQPILPAFSTCTIRKGRTVSTSTETGFDGGTGYFFGVVTEIPKRGTGNSESMTYKVCGPWWYLDTLVYQQGWKLWWGAYPAVPPATPPPGVQGVDWVIQDQVWSNGVRQPNYFTIKYTSHVTLNQRIDTLSELYLADFGKLTTGQQMRDTLEWATVKSGAPIQIGAEFPKIVTTGNTYVGVQEVIDAGGSCPNADVPVDTSTDMTCAEVIRKMMRWHPDAVTWFDYTTTPPTFHCKTRDGMKADGEVVDLPFDPDLGLITELDVTPRYDLKVPLVWINYEYQMQSDKIRWVQTVQDVYPTPPPPLTERFAAMVATIDMTGLQYDSTKANVSVIPMALEDINFWSKFYPYLTVENATVIPGSGTRGVGADTSFGNVLNTESAPISEWMNVGSQSETISAKVIYTDAKGNKTDPQVLTQNVTSTNAGTQVYVKNDITAISEPYPYQLARTLYNTLSILQFAGTVHMVEQEVGEMVSIGNTFNIVSNDKQNPVDPDWTTMNAMVTSVVEDVDQGTTEVTFGPPGHLGAKEFVELLRMTRLRQLGWASGTRAGGSAPSVGTDSPNVTAAQNSTSTTSYSRFVVAKTWPTDTIAKAKKAMAVKTTPSDSIYNIKLDAELLTDVGGNPITSEGAPIESTPSVHVNLQDMEFAANAAAILRRVHYTDGKDGTPKHVYSLTSPPEEDSDDGHNGVDDVWIGGGSGAGSGMYPFKMYQLPSLGSFTVGTNTHPTSTLVLETDDEYLAARITDAIAGGVTITGDGIPSSTTVTGITGTTNPTITISNPTTATVTNVTLSIAESWLWWRVRAGKVGLTNVVGTDGDNLDTSGISPNLDPDRAGTTPYDSGVDFKVTSGQLWGVWIDNTMTPPEVNAALVNSDGTRIDGESWWSGKYWLIGFIDATRTSTKRSIARQIVREDVIIACQY